MRASRARGLWRYLFLAIAAIWFVACAKNGTVTNAYKFGPSTKSIQAEVNLYLKTEASAGPNLQLGQTFLLNAYAVDDANQRIPMAAGDGTPMLDLPVVVTQSHLSMVATLQVPSSLQPSADGYALRFTATQSGASLQATDASLTARRGGISAGNAPSSNGVDLSVATTLAEQLLSASLDDHSSSAALSAYSNLVTILTARLADVEGTALSTGTPSLATYLAAVTAGLEYQVVTDKKLQTNLTTAIATAAPTAAASTETLASGFTSTLVNFATDAKNRLGSASTGEYQVFKTGTIDPKAVPDPSTYVGVVFAPAALSFTDTDTSSAVGGDIKVTAATVSTGLSAYNLYFGGETAATSRIKQLGTIKSDAAALTLTLAAGTALPSGVTRIWAYPVTTAGKELNLGTSLVITNTNTTGGGGGTTGGTSGGTTTQAPAAPTSVAASSGVGSTTVTWAAASGATSYNLYWSTTTPVSTSSNKIAGVSSPYSHTGLSSGTYYYAVTASANGLESALSSETQATATAPGAPTLSAAGGNSSLLLTWSAVSGATTYNVYYATSSPVTKASTKVSSVSSPYTLSNLTTGTYYAAVATVANGIESGLSNEASANVLSCSTTGTPFGGGSGTSADPYTICSQTHLGNLGSLTSGQYATFASDIDMTGATSGFGPTIGSNTTIDGNYHVVTHLTRTNSHPGLFYIINTGATVKNLGINADHIGAIDTFMQQAEGGIMAYISVGTISGCYTKGSIYLDSTSDQVGGITGLNGGTIENSYAQFSVSISGSLATNAYIGGLVGRDNATNATSINNAYAVMTGATDDVHFYGILGLRGNNQASITNSFWDTTVSSPNATKIWHAGATTGGSSTTTLQTPATFTAAGWSTSIWNLQAGAYPKLAWE